MIMEYNFDLQMFGAGEVVMGTTAYINAASPAQNQLYNGAGLSAEMKTFYDKTLIAMAGPSLVHDQFGQKRQIPKNGGKVIEFRKFSSLPKALTPITEGVTPQGNKLSVSTVNAIVNQYGDYVEQTDLLELTAIDNTIVETTKKLAEQAGQTLDTVVREVINGGTSVMYVSDTSGTSETAVSSRGDITAGCRLKVKDVFRAAAELKAMNAPKIDGSYVAIIHPLVAYDLMMEAGDRWLDIAKYASPESVLKGEIGKLGGVRFVETTEAKVFAPRSINGGLSRATVAAAANASTTVTTVERLPAGSNLGIPVFIGGASNLITSISNSGSGSSVTLANAVTAAKGAVLCGQGGSKNGSAVFSTLFLGADAFGVTDIEGGGIEHIVKQKGYGNDPLNQRSSIGWKALKCAEILVDEYMVRVESGNDFSMVTEAN